jgi:hypothetical protein
LIPKDLLGASLGCSFGLVGLGILAAETFDASGGIDQFLFAGEERMAVGADFYVDVALMSGAGHETVPARAHHTDLPVCRMDIGLHECF